MASLLIGKKGPIQVNYLNNYVEDGNNYSDITLNELLQKCIELNINTDLSDDVSDHYENEDEKSSDIHEILSNRLMMKENEQMIGKLGKIFIKGTGIAETITFNDILSVIEKLEAVDYFRHYALVDVELETLDNGSSIIHFRWEA